MKQIDISTKKYPNTFAIVDDEDFEYVNNYGKWHKTDFGYARLEKQKNLKIKKVVMHRFILERAYGLFEGKDTDHINNNKLDNRKCNLRICNDTQNLANRLKFKNKKSIYKGVSIVNPKNKKQRIVSSITKNRKLYYLGIFKTELEAARAYDKKAIELYGEYASINGV